MRIVQILPSMEGGEMALTALEFAQELVKQGHESVVISAGGELVSRLTLHGSQHLTLPVDRSSLKAIFVAGRLRGLLTELAPDIVHARGPMSARVAWKAWKKMSRERRPRLVTSVHEVPRNGIFRGRLRNAALARGEQIVTASSGLANYLLRRYRKLLGDRQPEVIYRGVNTRELDKKAPVSGHWHQRLLNDFPQLEGRHWLLLPAKVAPGQGQQLFLQMLAALSQRRDDVFGLIVGEIPEGCEKFARRLEQQAGDMGLSEKVLFLGPRRDMRELYATARITYELAEDPSPSSGRVVSEALAMGCPAIAVAGSGAGVEVAERCFPQGVVPDRKLETLVAASLEILVAPQPIRFDGFSLAESTARTVALYEKLTGQSAQPVGA